MGESKDMFRQLQLHYRRYCELLRTIYSGLRPIFRECRSAARVLRSKLQPRSITNPLLLGVLVTFSVNHPQPSQVKEFKLYKGATIASMVPVKTITVVPGQPGPFSTTYDFTDATPQYFGVSASNNFGESPIITKDGSGNDVLLGKPLAPTSFSFSVP